LLPGGPIRRAAIVITELRAGGAERVIVHLACALARRGIDPTVICLGRPGLLARDLDAAGVRVVALGSTRGFDVAAIWRLARVLQRIRPDVINVHDRASLPYVHLANRLAGRRPVVFSCHGLLLGVSHARWCERFAMRGAAALTAVSQETGRRYAALLDWPGPVDVVPNGVPLPEPDPNMRPAARANLGLADDVFTFLAVGNLKPEKGFEDLLEGAAILRDRLAGRRFIVLIAGGTSDEAYANGLEASLDRLNLRGVVRFLGYRPDTRPLYAAADVFVLSSRTEGLPMVLLEAMGAGLAVVATRVGGVPDVVTDGESGLLVASSEPRELADAMARLVDAPALRHRLGEAARQHIRSGYSVERMAERYLDVYRTAARGHATAGARPRVLMLGPLPPLTGGMATVTANLSTSALARTCRLAVINNGKTTPEDRSFLMGAAAQARLLGQVLAIICRENVQIVHIHTIQFFGFWRDCVHLLAARLLGCRVFLHNHGASFDQWAAQMGPLARGVLRWSFECAAGVIVLTGGWLEKLKPYAPRAQWFAVPNGVPLPDRVNDVTTAPPVFLFLGDWTARKGVHDLVTATELASERGFAGVVHLAGFEKEPGQLDALRRRIDEGPCASRFCILGTLSAPAKNEALASAHCLVLPSYAEGLPVAILEAMGHGLPIIATRVGAIGEAVSDGQEGFLIDPGDVAALADRICRLGGDPGLRQRMGEAARRRAEGDFSLDAMVDRIVALYDEVLT